MTRFVLALVASAASVVVGFAQAPAFDRLPAEVLDVLPPSARVTGAPGAMTVGQTTCASVPAAAVRRRIVDLAVQEWAFFGFQVVDYTQLDPADPAPRPDRRRRRLSPTEATRVADTIAGYWSVTPDGRWIIDAQNRIWSEPGRAATRWRYPWSAAFVSWVMCEGGLADAARFERAVAHHVYIDQAIRARDDDAAPAAYTAHDIGSAPVAPGDLLCSARRPAYQSIAERARQLGDGARTHCDIVVKLDEPRGRILAIGGNVRGSVSLKLLPAARAPDHGLRPLPGPRRIFAHLRLRAAEIEADALDHTPTMRALGCADGFRAPARLAAASLLPAPDTATAC